MNTRTTIIIVALMAILAILGAAWYFLAGTGTPPVPAIPTASPTTTPAATPAPADDASSPDIRVTVPVPNQTLAGQVTLSGTARGSWYFEASFPVRLEDNTGEVIATAPAEAQGEWMTVNFVPFQARLTVPADVAGPGVVVFERANPSGLPAQAEEVRIPVTLSASSLAPSPTTRPVSVFFSNSRLVAPPADECTAVFPVSRTIDATPAIARAALEELLKGPTAAEKNAGYTTPLNTGIKIQNLTITNGTARVDFNSALDQNVGGSCRVAAIRAAITRTLKQFPTVSDVVISIDGRTDDILQP